MKRYLCALNQTFINKTILLIFSATLIACGGGGSGGGTPVGPGQNNTPPIVNAGTDITTTSAANVQLAGNGSDAEGAVVLLWTQVSGPSVTLSNTGVATPSFTAPVVNSGSASIVLRLTGTDTNGLSVNDLVSITVNAVNTPPVVNAGTDISTTSVSTVQLAASGSDAEGSVTFQWSQVTGPAVSLSSTTIPNPTFTAPVVSTGSITIVCRLTVTDSNGVSVSDTVNITVNAPASTNTPPQASAGANLTSPEGSSVQLSGSGSDAESSVTVNWTQTSGPTVSLTGATGTTPGFTAPQVATGATQLLTFRLTVTDAQGLTATDTVSVTVTDVPLSANAGSDVTVSENTLVQLNGAGTGQGTIGYLWTQVSGPSVTLSNTTAASPSFTSPMVGTGGATIVLSLMVTDNTGTSPADSVTISVSNNTSQTSRITVFTEDNDNNGIAEGTGTISYNAAGQPTRLDFKYVDDGTPDLFIISDAFSYTFDIVYDTSGRVASITYKEPTQSVVSTYTYGANNLVNRNDLQNFDSSGALIADVYLTFTYTGSNPTTISYFDQSTSALLFTNTYTYDAQSRLLTTTGSNSLALNNQRFTWTGQKISLAEYDYDQNGTYEASDAFTYSITTGRVSNVISIDTNPTSDPSNTFTTSFIYNNGLLQSVNYDLGNNGSTDAVKTAITRETGACTATYIPEALPHVGLDGDSSSNIGDLGWCD